MHIPQTLRSRSIVQVGLVTAAAAALALPFVLPPRATAQGSAAPEVAGASVEQSPDETRLVLEKQLQDMKALEQTLKARNVEEEDEYNILTNINQTFCENLAKQRSACSLQARLIPNTAEETLFACLGNSSYKPASYTARVKGFGPNANVKLRAENQYLSTVIEESDTPKPIVFKPEFATTDKVLAPRWYDVKTLNLIIGQGTYPKGGVVEVFMNDKLIFSTNDFDTVNIKVDGKYGQYVAAKMEAFYALRRSDACRSLPDDLEAIKAKIRNDYMAQKNLSTPTAAPSPVK